ncbi:unnamed protein product, partial [Discosporangium mesarthrocarpum]
MRDQRKQKMGDGLADMQKILISLLNRSEAAAFREPVDWRGLDLKDYPDVVKRPMDLGTVKSLFDQGRYRTPAECASDIRLIWKNCQAYNTKGDEMHEASIFLSKRFEESYLKLASHLRKAVDGEEEAPAPTADERKLLARHLQRSRTETVRAVVHEIHHRCLSAMEKVGEDIDIDIDALDTRTFNAVEEITYADIPWLRREGRHVAGRGGARAGAGAAAGGGEGFTTRG